MVGIAVGLMLCVPAAPVPAQPPVAAPKADRAKAQEFATLVYRTGENVAARFVTPAEMRDLAGGAIRGLYEECNLAVPDRVSQALRGAATARDLADVLTDVRLLLADQPALRGPRALFAAINGFRHATDPSCVLTNPRTNSFASIDMDFGIGIELEGVTSQAWMLYQVEYKTARGQYPPTGWMEGRPRPEDVSVPVGVPWRIRRVVPDSPAQKAGLKPGDAITHFNGTAIAADTTAALFAQLAFPAQMFDPQTGLPKPVDRTLTLRRDGGKPFTVSVSSTPYTPTSAFGVIRTAEDKWDCMLDRTHKIGYIRLSTTEMGVDEKVAEMLAELDRRGCRGLILDLRWCGGGYIDPGLKVAGMLLPEGAVLAHMKYRNTPTANNDRIRRNDFTDVPTRYTRLPVAALIGPDGSGGELMASALRDNDRCVLIGQRTPGRGAIQNRIENVFGGLSFRITVGESFRASGKPRQRKPDSGPLDDWGVKPDEGLEVPVTRDKLAELRKWADLHSLRPAGSNEALDFDDPNDDPHRLKALDYLRKKLDKK